MRIAVLGATGRMGGATARALLSRGVEVRALTRNPGENPAVALVTLGAEVARVDTDERDTLVDALDGCDGVFNVQPAFDARGRYSREAELRAGRAVAEAAASAGVRRVVYGAAGTGARTGIPHFDAKLEIIDAFRETGARLTVMNPAPFMELMTDPGFAPAFSTWGAEPRVVGWDTPIPWIATHDVGCAAAYAFLHSEETEGHAFMLATERASLRQAREAYRAASGRSPRSFPMPVWVFRRMVGAELPEMWRLIRDRAEALASEEDFASTRRLVPEPVTLDAFLRGALAGGAH